jgi:hypothetical protein
MSKYISQILFLDCHFNFFTHFIKEFEGLSNITMTHFQILELSILAQ